VVERKQTVLEGAKLMAAGLAAAALIAVAPAAEAKVILSQPEVKNFVTGAEPAKAAASSGGAAAPAKTKAYRPPPAAETSEGFDFKPLVLPVTLVGLAGGAFALTVIDPGFAEMMVEGGSKDSRSFAGYEPGLKDTPFFGGSGSVPSSVPGGAAPKNAAAPKKAKKKGFF
jgi:hypothetical protein